MRHEFSSGRNIRFTSQKLIMAICLSVVCSRAEAAQNIDSAEKQNSDALNAECQRRVHPAEEQIAICKLSSLILENQLSIRVNRMSGMPANPGLNEARWNCVNEQSLDIKITYCNTVSKIIEIEQLEYTKKQLGQ